MKEERRTFLAPEENPEKLRKKDQREKKKKGRGERAKPNPKQCHFD